jgi:protein TonB
LPIVSVLILAFACSKQQDTAKIVEKSATIENAKDSVYYEVDEMPIFKGGTNELRRFVATNIKYPEQAKLDGTQGKVYISFTVSKTGKIIDVKAINTQLTSIDSSISAEKEKKATSIFEEEAVRVISLLPDWEPGKMKGKAVNVQFTIPINFNLN